MATQDNSRQNDHSQTESAEEAMEAPSNNDFRRLEEKVDRLTDAVMRLVVIEERQGAQGGRIFDTEQKIARMELTVSGIDRKLDKWINRGVGAWAVACAVFALAQFGMKIVGH